MKRFRRLSNGNLSSCCELQVRDFKTEEERRTAVIMRYLTLEKFLSLLELEAVWFSRLGALQDKFEGTLPRKARELSQADDHRIAIEIPEPRLRPALLKMTDQGVESCRSHTAVNCWFLGTEESEQMWRDYGQAGTGVAVRSTVKRLSASFQIAGDFAATTAIGCVKYVDFDSHEIEPTESRRIEGKAFLKIKSVEWEREVRVVTMNILHSGCLNPDGSHVDDAQVAHSDPNRKGFYLKCRLPELVQTVIVGPQAAPHFFTLVKRLVSRYRLFVDVERSKFSQAS